MKTRVVTCEEMKQIEQEAANKGLSYYQMMENAGTGAAVFINTTQAVDGKRIFVFCGKGNNGGDGFVVARKLHEYGAIVSIIIADGEPKTGDSIKNKKLCEKLKIPFLSVSEALDLLGKHLPAIIIDAVYGTGFRGSLKEEIRKITREINKIESTVYALDIPSGLNGDSGEADKDTVKANYTTVFHRYKPAHLMEQGKKWCGMSVVIDIGIDDLIK